jgi:hypothetical protein
MTRLLLCVLATLVAGLFSIIGSCAVHAADPPDEQSDRTFREVVGPFIVTYCHGCHGEESPKAKLNLTTFTTVGQIATAHQTWQTVLERLEAGEMPPEDARKQPSAKERQAVVEWIKAFRRSQADKNAGDPGVVPARRLNAAEYNYTIRDLTGVDIRPAREFPIDPANEAGFDNSPESLAMSPALLKKYMDAARLVADHLVLKPHGFSFAPHPVMTDTDRDKYCVRRIIDFYQRQPTDLADYFLAAWKYQHRAALGQPDATLSDVASASGVSSKYLQTVWAALNDDHDDVGPMKKLRRMWRELPEPGERGRVSLAEKGDPNGKAFAAKDSRPPSAEPSAECRAMRDWVKQLRRKLEPPVKGLKVYGVHEGSQSFVLWKNRQYAANRRAYDRNALIVRSDEATEGDPDLVVPADATERAAYEASFARFCSVFPDAFYVSERGRDYVGKPREQQEKGRLLSAGFHSQMGYFRDDGPLCEMILNEQPRKELDVLWQELDFVANVPLRQIQGFLWFDRTDSRFMRDAEFDPFRAEDKDAGSPAKIDRLAEVYMAKARANGGGEIELQAIADYFKEMSERNRSVNEARLAAEPSHLESLLQFAEQAFRRPLSPAERDDLLNFYRSLRKDDVTHEEAVQDVVVSILMSPWFCYRMDLASGWQGHVVRPAGAASNSEPFTDYELASRLSYFLWSSMPDAELLEHAAARDLHEPRILLEQTRRMLRDDKIRGLAVEFGGNWLDFRRFEQHNSVDRGRFPTFTNDLRQAMFEEPVRFFIDVAHNDRSVLEFLYGKHTFVNSLLAEHYELTDLPVAADEWVRVDDAAGNGRGGLLPMAVFLTQNAPGLRTSPVKRGYWVVRRLLGERIPAPPPNVPELPSDETKLGELTLRQTLAMHREHASCVACHERFDSFGLVFEGYGPIGERRDRDLGGRKVDVRAEFPGGSEGAGLDGLRTYIRQHRQQDFLDNLCHKLLSYALGRSLLPSDDQLLGQMRQRLAENDYRLSVLIETIVVSPQFLTKRIASDLTQN